ncbi:MAG: hypothetical protein E6468_05510 [Varibaculum cambriense]|uniref:hypothetical protein n=1 Tax=Varibaculum cambriense TaxID=184870 RepID=UPI00290ED0B8|nr:hypothetical protein [Varibaculum cambriense]MDU6681294.1 hypothetical protein [Varibaculum cambriense]
MKNWLRTTVAFAGVAALTLGSAVTATAANSVDDGSNVKSFKVTWSDKVDRYTPALKGSKVDMLLYCEVYEFKNGKKTGSRLGYEWPMLQLTVGKDEIIPLKIKLDKPEYQGVDKIGIEDCYQYRDGKWGPSKFSFSTGYSDGVKQLAMDQQANTDFKFKLTEGEWDGETYLGVIPEGKAPKVSIGLKLTKEGKTTTLENKDSKPAVNSYVFADGASHRPSAEVDRAKREDTRITRASIGNDLNLFSGYVGRYKKYTLTASIDDPEQAKLFRIESVEGNESDGWIVNLSSVIRKITPEAPTLVEANKCGVEGTVQLPESKYFDYETVTEGTKVSVAALLKQDFKDKFVVEGKTAWEFNVAPKQCKLATPVAPKLINPSADDPASCTVEPYVTIKQTEGVAYTVTSNGVKLKANKDGKYIYPYNSKVEVKASALDGYALAENAQTKWTWDSHNTALSPACKPAQPMKKLASTGAEVTALIGISALLLLAGGVLTARRFQ